MGLLQTVRDHLHPLHYARRSKIGRSAISVFDRPSWISIPGISFKVRGRRLSHGLSYSISLQEKNPKALALACLEQFKFRSFWDVGANFGYYAWLLKSAEPRLRVILVEPVPGNAKLIRDSIDRNGLADVALIEAGASDREGEGVLHVDSLVGSTSSLNNGKTFEQTYYGTIPNQIHISLISLDSIRQQHGPAEFVKIDVEGHETQTLQGAVQIIAEDRPVFFVECMHPNHACLDVLTSSNYRIVDGDTLSSDCAESSTNFYCIPSEREHAIGNILHRARKLS
jgi:FkbM family methyltransferase